MRGLQKGKRITIAVLLCILSVCLMMGVMSVLAAAPFAVKNLVLTFKYENGKPVICKELEAFDSDGKKTNLTINNATVDGTYWVIQAPFKSEQDFYTVRFKDVPGKEWKITYNLNPNNKNQVIANLTVPNEAYYNSNFVANGNFEGAIQKGNGLQLWNVGANAVEPKATDMGKSALFTMKQAGEISVLFTNATKVANWSIFDFSKEYTYRVTMNAKAVTRGSEIYAAPQLGARTGGWAFAPLVNNSKFKPLSTDYWTTMSYDFKIRYDAATELMHYSIDGAPEQTFATKGMVNGNIYLKLFARNTKGTPNFQVLVDNVCMQAIQNGVAKPVNTTATYNNVEKDGGEFVFTSALDSIAKITKDGATVDAANYTFVGGVLDFKQDYVHALAKGDHKFSVTTANGGNYDLTMKVVSYEIADRKNVKVTLKCENGVALIGKTLILKDAQGKVIEKLPVSFNELGVYTIQNVPFKEENTAHSLFIEGVEKSIGTIQNSSAPALAFTFTVSDNLFYHTNLVANGDFSQPVKTGFDMLSWMIGNGQPPMGNFEQKDIDGNTALQINYLANNVAKYRFYFKPATTMLNLKDGVTYRAKMRAKTVSGTLTLQAGLSFSYDLRADGAPKPVWNQIPAFAKENNVTINDKEWTEVTQDLYVKYDAATQTLNYSVNGGAMQTLKGVRNEFQMSAAEFQISAQNNRQILVDDISLTAMALEAKTTSAKCEISDVKEIRMPISLFNNKIAAVTDNKTQKDLFGTDVTYDEKTSEVVFTENYLKGLAVGTYTYTLATEKEFSVQLTIDMTNEHYCKVVFSGVTEPMQEVLYGELAKQPADPVKENSDRYTYEFIGWYNGETKFDFSTPVTSDLVLTAKFKATAITYTVTFDNGVEAQKVAIGGLVKEPKAPVKEGFVFAGWYNGDVRWDFAKDTVKGNMTLTAKFAETAPEEFTVRFDNGVEQKVLDGDKVKEPETPVKQGDAKYSYTFDGWYNGEAKWNFATDVVTSNLFLEAKFVQTINEYTVTFDNGVAAQTVAYGSKLQVPTQIPTKAADAQYTYEFKGWYEGDSQWNFERRTVTYDVALQAKFTATLKEYTVTFDSGYPAQKVAYGFTAMQPENRPVKEGNAQYTYTFDGWYNGDAKWDFEKNVIQGDVTLKAKFTQTVNTYTVTFDNGVAAQTVEYGAKAVAPKAPQKENTEHFIYAFDGWYNGDAKWNFDADTVKSDVELRARFTETVREFTVTFSDGVAAQKVKHNMAINYVTAEKAGYTFDGWYIGETKFDSRTLVTSDLQLTAKFTKVEEPVKPEPEKPETPDKPTEPEENKGGCGGSIGVATVALSVTTLLGAAALVGKKKH